MQVFYVFKRIIKFISLLLFILLCQCNDSNNKIELKNSSNSSPQIKNENYWEKVYFEESKRHDYPKYQGKTQVLNKYTVQFDNGIIRFYSYNPNLIQAASNQYNYLQIFEKGILHPGLFKDSFRSSYMDIMLIEEIKHTKSSPKLKRFKCSIIRPKAEENLHLFFFELSNESAKENTDDLSFIENSKLMYINELWILQN